jgi:hypothetical protein
MFLGSSARADVAPMPSASMASTGNSRRAVLLRGCSIPSTFSFEPAKRFDQA